MAPSIDVLSCGIIVADHVCTPISHLPAAGELVMTDGMLLSIGGCAANVAVDLAKMEVKSAIVGRVGNDMFGRIVSDMLRDAHVDTTGITTTNQAETSQTLIVNVKGEDRRFIHTFGANREFQASDIPLHLVSKCKVLYLGGYLLMESVRPEELAKIFQKAREQGVRTVLDVVVPKQAEYLSRLEPLLPHVDVFLPNNLEAEMITGEKDPFKQAELFHKMGATTSIITMGCEGAVLIRDDMRVRSGVFSMPFVDASGGGDAFDAGFIYGLMHGMNPIDCLRVASALGASCVRSIGTTPGVFTKPECESFLREQVLTIEKF